LEHKPPEHSVEQQSAPVLHVSPRTPHEPPARVAHFPPVQVWPQQSLLALQLAPVLPHAVAPQWPPLHVPRQQSVPVAHAAPAAPQNVLAVQTPAVQTPPPQQSLPVVQASPWALHMPPLVPPPLPPLPPVPPSPVCVVPQLHPTAVRITAASPIARFMAVLLLFGPY
jgi:hypothetical protein